MENTQRSQAIKHVLSTLFSAQEALRALAPEFRWAGLGNLLGDYGEFVCIEQYGLEKAPAGANGYDAITPDGQRVQIKASHAANQIGFRGEADLMLVIKVDTEGEWEEVYYGPFSKVSQQARYSARDNKHTLTISKLKKLAEEIASQLEAAALKEERRKMAELLMVGSFILFLIAFWLLRSARVKGAVGEMQVNSSLRGNLDPHDYQILSDLTLPTLDGGTTQVDHVIVSRFGIFVIETKNMSGWIFGDERQARWTQVIYQWKNQFQNPLRQNYKHVKTLQRLLGLRFDQLHNLVVFVGTSEPRTDMPYNVVWGRRQLIRLIRSYDAVLIHEDHINLLMTQLAEVRLQPGGRTSRRHKRDLKRKQSGRVPDVVVCSRCGAPMVERINSGTGELFLGCSQFPRCKGTKQLSQSKDTDCFDVRITASI